MTFTRWMKQVDQAISAECGLSHLDLADQPYHDWYDSEVSPKEAAQMTLQDEGFYRFVYGS